MITSNDHTDVGVVSLDDRRRIKDLEAGKADLERRLAEALGRVQPALNRERGQCSHHGGYTVSDTDLEVTCNLCDAKVDPYEVLRSIAHREVNFCYTLNSLRDESERLRKEVDKLKAARGRIRRQVRGTEDTPPAGIAAVMRAHKLYAISVAHMPGGGSAMAVATRSVRDELDGRQLRVDGPDIEAALTLLVTSLESEAASKTGGA